jgi:hypothetical protein
MIDELLQRNFPVVVKVHLHVIFCLLLYFLHQLVVKGFKNVFQILALHIAKHVLDLVEFFLVLLRQEIFYLLRINLATLVCVNVLANPRAQAS